MTKEQKQLAEEFYSHSLWEFSPPLDYETFVDAWNRNVKHLRDIADETDRIARQYMNRHAK